MLKTAIAFALWGVIIGFGGYVFGLADSSTPVVHTFALACSETTPNLRIPAGGDVPVSINIASH